MERARIERPYTSLDAFLDGDAWTVDRTDMLLVGAAGLAPGATIGFDIVLTTGEVVVSGEGRVVEPVAPDQGRPGGVRIRFRQLDQSSKGVLRRALELQKRRATAPTASSPEAAARPPEAPPPPDVAAVAPVAPPVEVAPSASPVAGRPEESTIHLATSSGPGVAATAASSGEPSGVRHRVPVAAPGNREALLGRLRDRARHGSAKV